LAVLTPEHFLIGDSLLAPPDVSAKDVRLSTLFMEGQRILRQFWKRLGTEWRSHLQARPKWGHESDNIQVDDVVLPKDGRIPPAKWKIGRIIEVQPGSENLVRVAPIKTNVGFYKPSVSKICRLPIPRATEPEHLMLIYKTVAKKFHNIESYVS